jgi:hypothetical protein
MMILPATTFHGACKRTWLGRFSLGLAFVLLLINGAWAGIIETRDDPSNLAIDLSAPTNPRTVPSLGAGCLSVDPTRPSPSRLPSSLDQPVCAMASAPAPVNHELLRIARADVSMKLGYVETAEPGSGLMRLLMSFSHFLNSGPLAGWQFRADAQLGRPPVLGSDSLLDERVKLFLGAKPIDGWNLHFDAIAVSHGTLDPSMAGERSLEVAADVSRAFIIPGLGQEHRVNLRLAEQNTQDRVAGTDRQATRATFGYAHNLGFGTIGADLALTRFTPGDSSNRNEARTEIKFTRPF